MAHLHHAKKSLPAIEHALSKQVMAGTMATVTVNTGEKLMTKITKHPLLVFGLGMIGGYFICKYRKEIIAGASKTFDAGKDFVMHQKESLEDLVNQAKGETEEQ